VDTKTKLFSGISSENQRFVDTCELHMISITVNDYEPSALEPKTT
jgi:hypothetical protein